MVGRKSAGYLERRRKKPFIHSSRSSRSKVNASIGTQLRYAVKKSRSSSSLHAADDQGQLRIPAAGGALPLLLSSKSVFRFCLGEAELIVYSL
ncbi:hypothetical protein PC112_g7973 [Phytophthora cactorum]|nr:hypothetical protein PC112_g7973 [Phytophthora cactorum]